MLLVADFETTVLEKSRLDFEKPEDFKFYKDNSKTEVWLSAFTNIIDYADSQKTKVQTDIREFFKEIYDYCDINRGSDKEVVCFFHNLKFDGSFIVNFLMKQGIPFETFINDMGVWYSITINFGDWKLVFRDSLKILNFKLSDMAKLFKMPMAKGETPLLTKKPKLIKENWLEYIRTDIAILARAIYGMYIEEKFTKFTSASEALAEFKKTVKYRSMFPVLDDGVDAFCRLSYRGGWTYVKSSIKEKLINKRIKVYDINSMYPSKMLYYPMPYGYPTYHKGKPVENENYYIARVSLKLKLREGFLPTLQTRVLEDAVEMGIKMTDYITSTNGEYYGFNLTNFDLELVKKHYKADIIYHDYYEFQTQMGIFDKYILMYKELKENAKTETEKQKAKIMLNALYGKFGAKITQRQKIVSISENGVNKFKFGEEETTEPQYVPLACFITSIARRDIITSAQENYDSFLYSDTDSIHVIDTSNIKLDLHPTHFGKWALESTAIKGIYLRSKLYAELLEDKHYTFKSFKPISKIKSKHRKATIKFYNGLLDVKGAGMTEEIKEQINFTNFHIGSKFEGKKATAQINGGMIIYDTEFTIKESITSF